MKWENAHLYINRNGRADDVIMLRFLNGTITEAAFNAAISSAR